MYFPIESYSPMIFFAKYKILMMGVSPFLFVFLNSKKDTPMCRVGNKVFSSIHFSGSENVSILDRILPEHEVRIEFDHESYFGAPSDIPTKYKVLMMKMIPFLFIFSNSKKDAPMCRIGK